MTETESNTVRVARRRALRRWSRARAVSEIIFAVVVVWVGTQQINTQHATISTQRAGRIERVQEQKDNVAEQAALKAAVAANAAQIHTLECAFIAPYPDIYPYVYQLRHEVFHCPAYDPSIAKQLVPTKPAP